MTRTILIFALCSACGGDDGGDDGNPGADAAIGADAVTGADASSVESVACTFPLTMQPAQGEFGTVSVCDAQLASCRVTNKADAPTCAPEALSLTFNRGTTPAGTSITVNRDEEFWAVVDQTCSDSAVPAGACCGVARERCGSRIQNVAVSMLPRDTEVEVIASKDGTNYSIVFSIDDTPPQIMIKSLTEVP